MSHGVYTKGMVWGVMGGLVGTIVMDLVLFGTAVMVGIPAVASFSTIGDTAAGFLALLGIQVEGGASLGAIVHYLLGLALGAIFGVAVTRVSTFRLASWQKGVILGVLYIEIVSQPILATSPIILKMTAAETWLWFGVSAVMHMIWGAVLGAVVRYGLRFEASAQGHQGSHLRPIG
ncbi:MAG: hypothetical protein KIT87_13415 [Anaerolineae bacterium]|nr:hypothetical protein [Anaerolineae bacterium]